MRDHDYEYDMPDGIGRQQNHSSSGNSTTKIIRNDLDSHRIFLEINAKILTNFQISRKDKIRYLEEIENSVDFLVEHINVEIAQQKKSLSQERACLKSFLLKLKAINLVRTDGSDIILSMIKTISKIERHLQLPPSRRS